MRRSIGLSGGGAVLALSLVVMAGALRPARALQASEPPKPESNLFDVEGDVRDATRPPAVNPAAPPAGRAVDLLPLIDASADAITGNWSRSVDGDLLSDTTKAARLQIPYRPPAEYDFVIEFTRAKGGEDVVQMLSAGGTNFAYLLGSQGGTLAQLSRVRHAGGTNPTAAPVKGLLSNNRRHRSVVSVRKGRVTASLDGRELVAWDTDYSDLSPSPAFPLKTPGLLGLATFRTATVFHRVELIEVFGRGAAAERAPAPAPAAAPDGDPPAEPAPAVVPVVAAAPPPDGRGLKAELFADGKFSRLVHTRYDPELDFIWHDGSPHPDVPPDHFSVRWTGYLRAPAPGAYKLVAGSYNKDLRVWLDGKPIFDGGDGGWRGIIVELGKDPVPIRAEFRDRGELANLTFQWVPPGAKSGAVVPAECLFHDKAAAARAKFGPRAPRVAPPKGAGVNVEVYAGRKFEGVPFRRVDRQIDWYWEKAAPVPGGPSDRVSIRFRTWLKAPQPGAYKLLLGSDDGHRLALDGRVLIDQFKRGTVRNEVLVDLTDKPHELVVEYYEDEGAAWITLHWTQVGGFGEQIIPPEAFFTDRAIANAAR